MPGGAIMSGRDTCCTGAQCAVELGALVLGARGTSPERQPVSGPEGTPSAPARLGIRPNGDTDVQPDLSRIASDELTQVFARIDDHVDEHVENPQRWILGPYGPAYLFAGDPLDMPIVGGAAGHGGNAHAAHEYYEIEGAGRVHGLAGAEKSVAMFFHTYAGLEGTRVTTD